MILALAIAAALAGASAVAPAKTPPHTPSLPPPTAVAPVTPAGPVTIYRMQQIGVEQPLTPELVKQMEPFHTLDEVEALLKANKIPFVWRDREVSSAQIAPQLLRTLDGLPPHEVFIMRQGQGAVFSTIVEQHPAGAKPSEP
jgi:hypothetical protein